MKILVVETIGDLMGHFGLPHPGRITVEDVDLEENDTDRHGRRRRDAEVLTTLGANCRGRILEIGTSYGHGTFKLASNQPAGGRVTTVNVLPDQISGSANLVTHLIGKDEIGSFWRSQGLSNVDQVYAETMAWAVPDHLRELDSVFVDGCHDTVHVRSDSHLLYDRVREGGFVLWHDFNPGLRATFGWIDEVMRGIELFEKDAGLELEIVHLRNSFMGLHRVSRRPAVLGPGGAFRGPGAEARPLAPPIPVDPAMRRLRYLKAFTAHDQERLDDEMAHCRHLREWGWDVEGFCLSVPGLSYAMPELDRAWKARDPRLLEMYDRLGRALQGKDVFVLWTGAMIHPDVVASLKSTYNVYVCSDDPESSDVLSRPVAPLFDYAFTRNLACVDDYRKWGCCHAKWLCPPIDVDYAWTGLDRRTILEGERPLDVVMFCERVLGLSDRAVRLEKLRKAFPQALLRGKGWEGGYVTREEMLQAYRTTKIGWNLHNSIGPTNSRLATLPAFGVMEICDNASQLAKVFRLDREIVGFETIEECIDKTRHYLAHDRERREIAAAGWERFTTDFTQPREWERIASKIQAEVLEKNPRDSRGVAIPAEGLALHLGCGSDRWDGWINIDREPSAATDLVLDIRDLPASFPPGSCRAIHLMHAINYLTPWEAREFFRTARSLLSPGGELAIETVDAAKASRRILEGSPADIARYIEGVRAFPGFGLDHLQEHREYSPNKMAWTPWHLRLELEEAGFASCIEEDVRTHSTWRDFRMVARTTSSPPSTREGERRRVMIVVDEEAGHVTAHIRGHMFVEPLSRKGWDATVLDARKASRERILETARASDAVLLAKVPSLDLVRAIRSAAAGPVVYDFTDALWLPFHQAHGWHDIDAILREAHAVVCDNRHILQYALARNPRSALWPASTRVELFDRAAAQAPPRSGDRIRLGWVGSQGTTSAIAAVAGPLARVAARHPGLELRVLGCSDTSVLPEIPGLAITATGPYDEPAMIREVLGMDVGLFPAPSSLEDYRNRGPLKGLLYMSGGIPSVCQRGGELDDILRDGVDGFLADSPEEWEHGLESLIGSAELRARMGRSARSRVSDRALEPVTDVLVQRLEAAILAKAESSARPEPGTAAASMSGTAPARRPRILIVADVPGWIFERHALTLKSLLADEFEIDVAYQGEPFDEDGYDLVYPLEWNLVAQQAIRTPSKWITGIRSHITWQDLDRSAFAEHLRTRFKAVHVVSRRLEGLLAGIHPDLQYLTHGIDLGHFTTDSVPSAEPGRLRVGWAGNRKSPAKGYETYIEPLGAIPGVELRFCGYSDTLLSFAEMRAFYEGIDVYVCSSRTEGSNNSLLEAAAMGRAIVTTDVGTVPEYLRDGVSALVVPREPEAFRAAVLRLLSDPDLRQSLGRAAAESVRAFGWDRRQLEHREFFRRHLPGSKAAAADPTNLRSRQDRASELVARADAAQAAGDPESCLAAIKEAAEILPESVDIVRTLAWLHLGRGELGLAQVAYTAAATMAPDDPDLQSSLAAVLLRRGQPERAEECLCKALAARPDDPEILLALGKSLLLRGLDEGAALLDAILRRDSRRPVALEARILLLLSGRRPFSRWTGDRSELQPLDREWLEALDRGEDLLAAGRPAEAKDRFHAVQKVSEGDPSVLASIGVCWLRMDDRLSARSFLHRALEYAPDSAVLKELVNGLPAVPPEALEKVAPRTWDGKRPRVHVAMLTFNALENTKMCLESLGRTAAHPHRIHVLDNASRKDGTREWLLSQDAPQLSVTFGEYNLGVPGGRNRLIDLVLPEMGDDDFFVSVDNDMEFFPGWDEKAISFLDAHPEVGILSSDGHTIVVGEKARNLLSKKFDFAPVDVACGGYVCWIRAGVLRTVGGYDETLGLFWHEDDDFTIHALASGFEAVACTPMPVLHHGHKSGEANAGLAVGGSPRNQEYLVGKWRRLGLVSPEGRILRGTHPQGLRQEFRRARGGDLFLEVDPRGREQVPLPHPSAPATKPPAAPSFRVGFDGRTFSVPGSVVRGIGHYSLHLLLAILRERPGCDLTVLTDDRKPFPEPIRSRLLAAGAKFAPWSTRTAEDFDVFHASDPMHIHPEFASPFHRFGSTRSTATFYDIIPMRMYKGRIANWPGYLARLDQMRSCGTELHCISDFTRRDLLSATSFDPSKVRVVMAGFNESESTRAWTREEGDAVLARLGIDKPFLLHVGAADPHKNFETGLAAALEISRIRPVQFVFAGKLENSLQSVRDQVLKSGIRDVVFTDYLPREELELLYSRAVATLFLSRYEGFGFPALEAMANGCPVVCSNTTSLPEVVGEAALLHGPDDLAGVVSSLKRLMDDPDLRASLVARGRARAEAFPWSAVATRTWEAWDEIADTPAPATRPAAPPARVEWVSPVWDPSGYGAESRAFVRQLAGSGLHLALQAWGRHSESFRQAASPSDRALFDGLMGRETVASPVTVLDMPGSALGRVLGSGHHVGRTTFETDGLPAEWIARCDSMDELWVPSTFNLRTFRQAGVRKPILVLPEGVDTAKFRPGTEPLSLPGPRKGTTYLAVFEWTHRKGPDLLLEAWARAFGPGDDARLVLRTYPPNEAEGDPTEWVEAKVDEELTRIGRRRADCAPIIAIARQVPDEDMPRLYAAADVLVAPSRGEGWGRPHMEAMSSGIPVIATRWSGNLDFQDDNNSWLIDIDGLEEIDTREEFPSYRGQKWAKPSVGHLAKLLKSAMDPELRRKLGRKAREDMVERWDWTRVAPMAEARIREILDGVPAERSSLAQGGSTGADSVVHSFSVQRILPALHGRIPIAMPAYNREAYLQQVLSGLRSNGHLDRFFIVTGEEPGCPQVKALFDALDWIPVVRNINPRRLGCRGNVLGTIDRAFEFGDRAVVLEDDIVPAPDFLSFLLWGLDRFQEDPSVFDISAYRRIPEEPPRSSACLAARASWFVPWGWATWKDRWTRFLANVRIPEDAPDAWGSWVCDWVVKTAKLQEIQPLVGRVQNIGEVGMWVPNPQWHRENQHTKHWMVSLGWPTEEPSAFRLVSDAAEEPTSQTSSDIRPCIRWCGQMFNFTGYASLARDAVTGLMDAGIPVTADPLLNDLKWFEGASDRPRWKDLLQRVPLPGVLVCCDVPRDVDGRNELFDQMAAANPGNPRRVGWTMFETDRLPAGWVDSLNCLDEVWVPSGFNRKTFSDAGVDPHRIHVVPGSVDGSRYGIGLPYPLPGGRKGTTFLSVFQWVRRKGWDVLLRAWAQAFDPKADVRLVLRCHPFGKEAPSMRELFRRSLAELGLAESAMAPIVLLDDFVPESAMPSLYLASDVFVLPSRGEGWGLPYLEAMASGKPCIATAWGASMDFLNEDNAWLASPRELVPVGETACRENPYLAPDHKWADPDPVEVARLLRRAASDIVERERKGLQARFEATSRWNPRVTARAIAARSRVLLGLPEPAREGMRPQVMTASGTKLSGVLEKVAEGLLARGGKAVPSAQKEPEKPLSIRWEGSQFVHHSLAMVNRELCLRLAKRGHDLSLVPWEPDQFGAGDDPDLSILERLRKAPLEGPCEVHVRHQWPPLLEPPEEGKWVVVQPWEFGSPPVDWMPAFRDRIDELWVPSNYCRDLYLEAGVPEDRVRVVPNGVDTDRFRPGLQPLPGLEPDGRITFLYVGGTIARKGFDVLLNAWRSAFGPSDPVRLLVKAMGGETFYKGQTGEAMVAEINASGTCAPVLYVDRDLSLEDLPRIYASGDVLVHPYRGEGFGLPIAEAMSCGLPVVVTRGGASDDFCGDAESWGIPAERVDVPGGVVGPFQTVSAPWWLEPSSERLAEILRAVAEDAPGRRAKGMAGRRRILSHWTWDHAAAAAEAALGEVARRPGVRREGVVANPIDATMPDAATESELLDLNRILFRAEAAAGRGAFDEAETATREAVEAYPNQPLAWLARAMVLRGLRKFPSSIAAVRKSIALRESPDALLEAVLVHRLAGQDSQARLSAKRLKERHGGWLSATRALYASKGQPWPLDPPRKSGKKSNTPSLKGRK